MNTIINLPIIRQDLNNGSKYRITYYSGIANMVAPKLCICRWNPKIKEETDFFEKEEFFDIISPDKKSLIKVLSKSKNTGLLLGKEQNQIISFLIRCRYTDPMNLMKDYYDLPFLSVRHEKLKTSLYKLNEVIRKIGLKDLINVLNENNNSYLDEEYYSLQLKEDKKSLELVKRYNPKNQKHRDSENDDLPF